MKPTATRNSGLKNGPLGRRYLLDRQLERLGACAAFPSVVPLYFFSVGGFRGSVYRFLRINIRSRSKGASEGKSTEEMRNPSVQPADSKEENTGDNLLTIV